MKTLIRFMNRMTEDAVAKWQTGLAGFGVAMSLCFLLFVLGIDGDDLARTIIAIMFNWIAVIYFISLGLIITRGLFLMALDKSMDLRSLLFFTFFTFFLGAPIVTRKIFFDGYSRNYLFIEEYPAVLFAALIVVLFVGVFYFLAFMLRMAVKR